jgi:hypothetical protein
VVCIPYPIPIFFFVVAVELAFFFVAPGCPDAAVFEVGALVLRRGLVSAICFLDR